MDASQVAYSILAEHNDSLAHPHLQIMRMSCGHELRQYASTPLGAERTCDLCACRVTVVQR